MLLITGADQFVGYAVASHLAKYKSVRPYLRLLCEDKSLCSGFDNIGLDVRVVNHAHPNDLSLAMRSVEHLVLAIGYENNRVEYCKNICEMAVKANVKSIICLSHVGAGSARHDALQDYMQIEMEVMKINCQKIIFRLDFLQQGLHLMAGHVEVHRQLVLPLNTHTTIAPVDIEDVCQVIECILLNQDKKVVGELDRKHDGQVYLLTGPESIYGEDLVQCLIGATDYQKFKFKTGRLMDLEYYLSELKKNIPFDSRIKQEKTQLFRDTFVNNDYSTRAHSVPTRKQIQTFVDYFDWAEQSANSVSVPHASMITNQPCQTVQSFFLKNANSFKPKI
ncbi:hypothetical protein BDB01DRAFT_854690 [Pilobolus umbonatus]|nr:hypothetical protein BDB01DRAFT_854690 [Pilobolus umbonatus]